jgi:hypothetical protein
VRAGRYVAVSVAEERSLERREFIGAATRTTAALLLGGSLGLACGDDSASVRATRSDSAGPAAGTSPSGSTPPGVTDVAFRLSTRRQHAPCNACKAHAAHRYFASAEAADSGRAHPGCTCDVLAQRVTSAQLDEWFVGPGRDVLDDRWTT